MFSKEEIKSTGATFTPPELAEYLSDRLLEHVKGEDIRVLDPSCGDGELLLSISKKLSTSKRRFNVFGYDSNEHYLNQAKSRLNSIAIATNGLLHSDFLTSFTYAKNPEILNLFSKPDVFNDKYDVVIANPPYVRTQVMGGEQAQIISKKFGLKGRIDLYYPFLIGMTESLQDGGVLGVITSNRYLFTKSGESIREYITKNYEIIELIDLGDTKLFDAAVLPAILIARKKVIKNSGTAKFTKIYEDTQDIGRGPIFTETIYTALRSGEAGYFKIKNKVYKKTIGLLSYSDSTEMWKMLTEEEASWIKRIEKSSTSQIRDIFKVKVGIKTTADKVFISDKWEHYGEYEPESEILKDLISQENIGAWSSSNNVNLKVLYPHENVNGRKTTIDLNRFPKANRYLHKHKELLSSRKYLIEAGRKWYEIWVAHNPELWKFPKLVFPDISGNPRFTFDTSGKIVNGNCYWIVATNEREKNLLLLIQGIANSNLMTKYHDLLFNNKLYSGKRRYLSQYVEKYPLPDFDSDHSKRIVEISEKLNSGAAQDKARLLKELEISVAEAYGVSPLFTLD